MDKSIEGLHAAIMNLPFTLPASGVVSQDYLNGHRDARHAAAELVAAQAAPAVPAGEALAAAAYAALTREQPQPVHSSAREDATASWTTHDGGPRPTHEGHVDLLFRDGDVIRDTHISGWVWKHDAADDDIIGWRIASDTAAAGPELDAAPLPDIDETVYACTDCDWSGRTDSNCPRCAAEVTTAAPLPAGDADRAPMESLDRLDEISEQIQRAYGHLPKDRFPGPPGGVCDEICAIAASLRERLSQGGQQ